MLSSMLLTMALLGPAFLLRDPALPWLPARAPAERGLFIAGPLLCLSEFWEPPDVRNGFAACACSSCFVSEGCNAI